MLGNIFALLFFLVPLVFVANTSELFEFNKMMLTYAFTILIVGVWLSKMVLAKKFIYKHTFLEIPLLLYLGSHILSTAFSIDPHISIWGYYSRFHEGLLASLSYIILYFAAVSNLNKEDVKKIFLASFASATIISIWGALEHFGHSPSCYLVTGKFGVDCWVQDVKTRVFATLGQPNWMAAYLCVQILILIGFVRKFKILNFKFKIDSITHSVRSRMTFLFLIILFISALIFTKSRSGYAGLAAGLGVLTLLLLKISNKIKLFLVIAGLILVSVFGWNWYQNLPAPGPGVTNSEAIRKPVWEGAVKIWQRYPVFGSGVETFAYSFYLDRPASKNLDSEWDFLYNKAHNEYLNLLATTGTVGIITYLIVIGTFISWALRHSSSWREPERPIGSIKRKILSPFGLQNDVSISLQHDALFAAWVSILVTNFFGFSIVIIGLYFFLIPAFCEILSD